MPETPKPADHKYLLDRAGQVLSGRYRVKELLGVGAMGSVWIAELIALRRPVVVKFHEEGFSANVGDVALQRFFQEAQALSHVQHRNVIELYEAGQSDDASPYLIMEKLTGRTLASRMRDDPDFEVHEAVNIAISVAEGLRAVHGAGVLHRDIKPENIFLHEEGKRIVPKLIDFGLARDEGRATKRLTRGNKTVGTPGYMAPEQARGTEGLDERADVYSLGVVLYEMLSGGALPVDGQTGMDMMIFAATEDPVRLSIYRPDLKGPIEDVVMQSITRDRDRRYPDATAFGRAIRPFGNARRSITMTSGERPVRANNAKAPADGERRKLRKRASS